MTEVTCAHCGAANEINVPDDYAGDLKWECRPCGGVCAIRLGADPDVEAPVLPDGVVAISDSDAGGAVEAAG